MTDKPKFNQLLPILFVKDLEPEVAFYKTLGFEVSYEGDEFPGFIGLKSAAIEFGLKAKEDFDLEKAKSSFVWQMDTTSFQKVITICRENDFDFTKPKQYWEAEDMWEMTVKTPNGYDLHLEKVGEG